MAAIAGNVLSHEEREQTLNQLLVEMDGFTQSESTIVVAATNRPTFSIPAAASWPLRQAGHRRQPRPARSRADLASDHAVAALELDVDPAPSREARPAFSADLANIVNEVADSRAFGTHRGWVPRDPDAARDKVLMGVERKSVAMSEHERVTCAYHEAGHAVVAAVLPDADPLHKVTIMARPRARRHDAAARSRSA